MQSKAIISKLDKKERKNHEERIKDLEESFNLWESRNAKGSLSGVFSKLDEEELNSMNRKKYR